MAMSLRLKNLSSSISGLIGGTAPFKPKIVIHVGMPKSGSTSIQEALCDAQNSELLANGLWYLPPTGRNNDENLYQLVTESDDVGLKKYIDDKLAAARAHNADTVLFSAEKLFFVDARGFTQLISSLQRCGGAVEVIVVIRDLISFLRSYLLQLIYNGSLYLDDLNLAEWMVLQVKMITRLNAPVTVISFDQCVRRQCLVDTFLSVVTGKTFSIQDYHSNKTPNRPLIYALAEGIACKFAALERADDVNSPAMDQIRQSIRTNFDGRMNNARNGQDALDALTALGAEVQTGLDTYVNRSIAQAPTDLIAFYSELCKYPAKRFEGYGRKRIATSVVPMVAENDLEPDGGKPQAAPATAPPNEFEQRTPSVMDLETLLALPSIADLISLDADPVFRAKIVDLPKYVTMWGQDVGDLSGKRILELGCGQGITACGMALHTKAALVYAVDIVNEHSILPELIARQTILPGLPPNLKFERIAPGDVAAENNFDFAYSWSVFEQIDLELLPGIIQKINMKLVPGGYLYIQISPLYFSPEGSHLWRIGYLNWEHLKKEVSAVHRDIYFNPTIPDAEKASLWNLYGTLNRLTADNLIRHVTAGGFGLVREKRDWIDTVPPPELLNVYDRDALTLFQITLLFQKEP